MSSHLYLLPFLPLVVVYLVDIKIFCFHVKRLQISMDYIYQEITGQRIASDFEMMTMFIKERITHSYFYRTKKAGNDFLITIL